MAGGRLDNFILERTCGECAHWSENVRPVFGRTDVRAGDCWAPLPFWRAADPSEMPVIYADCNQATACNAFRHRDQGAV